MARDMPRACPITYGQALNPQLASSLRGFWLCIAL